jgi:hypothetical protein
MHVACRYSVFFPATERPTAKPARSGSLRDVSGTAIKGGFIAGMTTLGTKRLQKNDGMVFFAERSTAGLFTAQK